VAFESEEKFVYFAKPAEPGIWRVPAMGGEETQVLDQVPALGWALSGKGICFFDVTSPVGPVIKFYELATRKQRAIHQFPKDTIIHLGESALSVSPDGRWILYTKVDQAGSDLMLVDNFR
jgi:2-succinyl-5-enolpyruvyl-6-hydroxy-3-cyclohexene-1-carboxylate synthase